MSAARVPNWALLVTAYSYQWGYRKGSDIANADALSRSPLPEQEDEPEEVHFVSVPDTLSARQIRTETRKDKVLSKVLLFTKNRWPSNVTDEALIEYFRRRSELSVEQQCVT
uniref:Putative tick transposon n=1 Tax=Rhipicephalus pulchellus TaxID=72859 RepID=L7LWG6_RHIPC